MYPRLDVILRGVAISATFLWLLLYGTVFEAPYPKVLVQLHALPLWRLLLAVLVLVAAMWCPRVGLLMAIAVLFYLADLEALTK